MGSEPYDTSIHGSYGPWAPWAWDLVAPPDAQDLGPATRALWDGARLEPDQANLRAAPRMRQQLSGTRSKWTQPCALLGVGRQIYEWLYLSKLRICASGLGSTSQSEFLSTKVWFFG